MLWLATFSPLFFAVPLALVGAFGIVSPFMKAWMWVSSVTLTSEGIEGVTYARRRRRIRWDELRRIEIVHSFAFDASEFVRLVGRGPSINFTDAIEAYPELMGLLDACAPQVPRARLPWYWLLLLVGGIGGTVPDRPGSAARD